MRSLFRSLHLPLVTSTTLLRSLPYFLLFAFAFHFGASLDLSIFWLGLVVLAVLLLHCYFSFSVDGVMAPALTNKDVVEAIRGLLAAIKGEIMTKIREEVSTQFQDALLRNIRDSIGALVKEIIAAIVPEIM